MRKNIKRPWKTLNSNFIINGKNLLNKKCLEIDEFG